MITPQIISGGRLTFDLDTQPRNSGSFTKNDVFSLTFEALDELIV
jgi:hypothetical protein